MMKKTVFLILIVVFTFFTVKGQEVLNKGNVMFNSGIGVLSSYGFIPSINFSGEVGVIPTGSIGIVSFGGEAEYKMELWSVNSSLEGYGDSGIINHIALGGKAAWHLHVFNNPKYDLYSGLSAGYRMITDESSDNYIGVYQTVFFGARIMTSSGFGFFAELSGGYKAISYVKIGITFKL